MRGWAGQMISSVSLNKITEWPGLASNVLSASLIGAYTAASLPSRDHIIALVLSMLFVNAGQSLIFMMRPNNSPVSVNSQSFINSIPVGLLAVAGVGLVFIGCFTIQSLSRHDSRWLIVGLFVLMSLQFQFSERPILAVVFSAAVRACYFLLAGLVFSDGFPVLLAWIAGLIFTFHVASHFASVSKQSFSVRKIWAIILMLPLAAYATSGFHLFPKLIATTSDSVIAGIPNQSIVMFILILFSFGVLTKAIETLLYPVQPDASRIGRELLTAAVSLLDAVAIITVLIHPPMWFISLCLLAYLIIRGLQTLL
ncbi:hypothetical protein [Undibacterium luofuense]|mgnify:CR=1 FL=1|uniref:hypothetical protein n=1 Tax=Undibacterium luofuense TaxID=2828733 RepID=UPI0030EF534D